jgi:ribosomal protein S18 acetylase RimI-like enzyme
VVGTPEAAMTWRAPACLHDVFGETPDVGELAIVALAGIGGASLLLAGSSLDALGLARGLLAWLLLADVAAGCIANFTRSTNDYYAARPGHRWIFIAVHVHLLALGWLLGELTASVVGLWAYVIVGAAIVNALAGRAGQVFVGGTSLMLGLVAVQLAPDVSPAMRGAAALFSVKVLYAFAVDHYAHARTHGREGLADLQAIDEPAARELLAAAFARDPLFVAVAGPADAPASAARRRAFAGFVLAMNRVVGGRPRGCFRAGALVGVALLEPPASSRLAAGVAALRFVPVALRVGARASALLNRYWLRTREAAPRERHHYLALLGVAPHMQGQGIGKQLVHDAVERARAEGSEVVALDTENQANVALYEHLGFVETQRLELDDASTIHCMRRAPALGSS